MREANFCPHYLYINEMRSFEKSARLNWPKNSSPSFKTSIRQTSSNNTISILLILWHTQILNVCEQHEQTSKATHTIIFSSGFVNRQRRGITRRKKNCKREHSENQFTRVVSRTWRINRPPFCSDQPRPGHNIAAVRRAALKFTNTTTQHIYILNSPIESGFFCTY